MVGAAAQQPGMKIGESSLPVEVRGEPHTQIQILFIYEVDFEEKHVVYIYIYVEVATRKSFHNYDHTLSVWSICKNKHLEQKRKQNRGNSTTGLRLRQPPQKVS